MRGPISTCFLTCSIARSPLNTTAPGTTAGLASVARSEVATRELGGASFFGQPANTSEKDKRNKTITKLSIRTRKAKRKNAGDLLLTRGKRAPLWNATTCHRFVLGSMMRESWRLERP